MRYCLLTEKNLESAESVIAPVIAEWHKDWFGEARHFSLEISDASKLARDIKEKFIQSDSLLHRLDESGQRVCSVYGDFLLLPGPGSKSESNTGELGAEIKERVVSNLVERLEKALATNLTRSEQLKSADIRKQFAPGAGTLMVRVFDEHSRIEIEILFSGFDERFVTAKPVDPGTELSRREEAIGPEIISLVASLGTVSLTIAELRNVAIGDVIRLETGIHDHVIVKKPGSKENLARARLYKTGDYRSLQLV